MKNLKLPLFLKVFIFFSCAQLIGLFAAPKIIQSAPPAPETNFSAGEVILFVLVLAVFIFLLKKFGSRSAGIYRFFLGLSVLLGIQAILSIFISGIWNVILPAFAVFLFFTYRRVIAHNLILIAAIAGITDA